MMISCDLDLVHEEAFAGSQLRHLHFELCDDPVVTGMIFAFRFLTLLQNEDGREMFISFWSSSMSRREKGVEEMR